MTLIESSYLCLTEAYGAWMSPQGKMILVHGVMGHESKAKEILGGSSTYLAEKGWARIVFKDGMMIVDTDTGVTRYQKRELYDYGIENNLEVMHDTGAGLRPL